MTDSTAFALPSISQPARWHRSGLLIGLVAVVMSAILGWMVWDRVSLLRHGREIVLPVTPVDPRSLFRGDYVILGYAVTQAPAPAIAGHPAPARAGSRLFVTLEQEPGGDWKAISTSSSHPGVATGNRVVLQGKSQTGFWRSSSTPTVRVRYGIESFFVPEGKGLDLEKAVRDKKIAARIAVDGKGRAAIKGLLVDGKPLHDEPLL